MSAQDTPRAFPGVAIEDAYAGMALRDYFAAQHSGLDSDASQVYAEALTDRKCPVDDWLAASKFWAEAEAAHRYIYADAMLAERAKRLPATVPTQADVLRAIDSCGGANHSTDPIGRAWETGYNDALKAADSEVKRLYARLAGGTA